MPKVVLSMLFQSLNKAILMELFEIIIGEVKNELIAANISNHRPIIYYIHRG